MKQPKISAELLELLRSSGQSPPWRCKGHLPRGRIIYGMEITEKGEITRVGDRLIYSEADVGFRISSLENLTIYT